ncbi:MAG TPA: hypothetical protein VEZ51_05410, partial [Gemmatimonadaceae bacterium]|nr:hypothetical protein [Gemmatimonadaceae bacterium]
MKYDLVPCDGTSGARAAGAHAISIAVTTVAGVRADLITNEYLFQWSSGMTNGGSVPDRSVACGEALYQVWSCIPGEPPWSLQHDCQRTSLMPASASGSSFALISPPDLLTRGVNSTTQLSLRLPAEFLSWPHNQTIVTPTSSGS